MMLVTSFDSLATAENRSRAATWTRVALYVVVIDHPGGRILWDTSAPRDWKSRWSAGGGDLFNPYEFVSEDEYFESRLDQLGLSPHDFDTVILSHLHVDHAGNAQLFGATDATLVVNERELAYATSFAGEWAPGYVRADYDGLNFQTVSGDVPLLPGITLLDVPGHSRGQMALQVDLPETGTMLFTSDAADYAENWGPPVVGSMANWDPHQYIESIERLRGIAERTDALVVFGHDAEQLDRLRLANDGGSYT